MMDYLCVLLVADGFDVFDNISYMPAKEYG
jgi:hypothetical protein